jgi:hypothetical protein
LLGGFELILDLGTHGWKHLITRRIASACAGTRRGSEAAEIVRGASLVNPLRPETREPGHDDCVPEA